MRIIGVDPGLASTGYGIIESENNKIHYIYHGVITTSSELPLSQRLFIIYNAISDILDEYEPEEAGIEALFFVKNISSAIPVAHAKGVVHLAFAMHNINVCEYSPQAIKMAVVGEGRADKKQVQEMTKLILGLPDIPKPDHAADALSAAICHLNSRSFYHV